MDRHVICSHNSRFGFESLHGVHDQTVQTAKMVGFGGALIKKKMRLPTSWSRNCHDTTPIHVIFITKFIKKVQGWQEKVTMEPLILHCHRYCVPSRVFSVCNHQNVSNKYQTQYYQVEDSGRSRRRNPIQVTRNSNRTRLLTRPTAAATPGGVPLPPLDLTEDNVKQVLADAREEFGQLFDRSVGMTGEAELAELDGPFVKISLRGRFWHERSLVLARLGNYLKQRIPEILEVDIEDEKQLDDSPENF
ncbi:hypothetical protein Dsin_027342 [Dipteronia sinensis]|uniref:Uncharacterized protein n=1 Tax=Dipteronia sinensis TaxID=43782 RepID=A0AAE0DTH4_9ROSI|nr:hypothetical protein Dsin_027342 [Dipteronia sinensis]